MLPRTWRRSCACPSEVQRSCVAVLCAFDVHTVLALHRHLQGNEIKENAPCCKGIWTWSFPTCLLQAMKFSGFPVLSPWRRPGARRQTCIVRKHTYCSPEALRCAMLLSSLFFSVFLAAAWQQTTRVWKLLLPATAPGHQQACLRPGHIVALEPLHDQHERGCVWVGPWTAIHHKNNECRVCPCYQVLFRLNLLSRNLGNAVSQVTTSSIEARLVKADCTVFRGRAFCTTKSPTKKYKTHAVLVLCQIVLNPQARQRRLFHWCR